MEDDFYGEGSYTCTVDKATLALLSYTYESADGDVMNVSTTLGGEAPEDPFWECLDDLRTVTVHRSGFDYDGNPVEETKTWSVPASWEFAVYFFGEEQLYTSSALNEVYEDFIPADGRDYEFWASAAKG